MKIFGISGYSNSGKTTVALALIKALRARGYTISTVKGIHLTDFTINEPESDTWRHLQAGAESAIARTHSETVRFWNHSLPFPTIVEQFSTDFVLVEGMKSEAIPKILCAKDISEMNPLMNEHVFAVSGLIANSMNSVNENKIFHYRHHISELTDLAETHALIL